MFVVYEGPDEVIVTTKKREVVALKEFFEDVVGRDREDYYRKEVKDCGLLISSYLKVD